MNCDYVFNQTRKKKPSGGETAGGIGEFFEFYLLSEVENSARCQTTGSIGAARRHVAVGAVKGEDAKMIGERCGP